MDGAVYSTGDSAQKFTIQSISKPFVYATALADRGVKITLPAKSASSRAEMRSTPSASIPKLVRRSIR